MALTSTTLLEVNPISRRNQGELFMKRLLRDAKRHTEWQKNGIPEDVRQNALKEWGKSWSNAIELPK